MLNKKRIDKKLRSYIGEHAAKGYSKHAIRHVLISHGYDEGYVDGLLKKHSELRLVKAYSIFVSLLFMLSIFAFNLIPAKTKEQQITGFAASNDEGCCTSICRQTSKAECYGGLVAGKKCNELEECNVGCCIDKEGYCLTNYLQGNCISGYGTSINKDCSNLVFCRNITDKSYGARRYNLKNKAAGFSYSKSNADYYKSSFSIQYYLYDKTNVASVIAQIKDNGNAVDSIALYDDGSHNDGSKNDNLYGNNWLSSKIKDFEGFKKFDVDIMVSYAGGILQSINKTQSITLLKNNKCLPIVNEWDSSKKHSMIFAAQNYEDYGFQRFETDVQNFLNVLFSADNLKNNKELNIYRLEQSLSYFNIPTLASIASSSCPAYSNKKDMLIVLDPNEEYCIMESSRIIRVNPQALFYRNITSKELNETFADFCSYTITPKKLADDIIAFATPPKITVHTLENGTYNSSFINLSFSVSAINYPVNNSVFLDNQLVFNNAADEETAENVAVNLANGTNYFLIKSVDKNKNKAFAQVLLNTTIQ
ncbi:hypothetical protein HYV80_01970 [Candidatus Woesearchaeota archaeon]|nr:hypothetical protein [Candidatus Woesearchaeota archaeon]